ncbi:type II toxin-antitoxin system VapC family toxin [Iamia sp.]|uniref:type II toxin-antitoxin system VapC family toxin n=1 Tax=Iamia sp. TaxID=2722710 RepID=UPI002CCC8594|nr:PIN domain nuclease [Iamia sp.]HXH57502.1 PIN domain nuclease [Iamia sp.]
MVDTSVWIDLFRDAPTWQVDVLAESLDDDRPIALTDIVVTEILQGLSDDAAAARVESHLVPHEVLTLEPLEDHRRAAGLYRTCRQRGVTIRRTLDCLIASVCIREDLPLLHADVDFDRLASHTELRVVAL